MRSLVSLAGILSAVLVASSTIAGSGQLSRLQMQPGKPDMQSAPVKFAPEGASPSPFAPRAAVMPQQSLPAADAGVQTRIKVTVRCGTTNLYCNPPTPVCCGTPGKYFCAKDASGCNQQ
jgi:hypothetical protein